MKGWVGLGWLVTCQDKVPRVEPGRVIHPSTNRARRRVTSLIRPTLLPLRHACYGGNLSISSTCRCCFRWWWYSWWWWCRFEKLDITPKSAQKIKPVLERWMAMAEERYKNGAQNLCDFIGLVPSKKRKRRTSFTPQALEILNEYFERSTHPTG